MLRMQKVRFVVYDGEFTSGHVVRHRGKSYFAPSDQANIFVGAVNPVTRKFYWRTLKGDAKIIGEIKRILKTRVDDSFQNNYK